VKLPTTENGEVIVVANGGANTLLVYPKAGSTIDGAASKAIAATKAGFFVAVSPTVWISILGA
jgi:hypothetical protein